MNRKHRKSRKSNEAKLAALAWAPSDERLGRIFGHHRMSFSRWRREHTDAPRPRANGDHSVPAWRKWFDAHPEIKDQAAPVAARERKTLLECEKLEFEIQVRKGKFLAADYVTQLLSELCTLLNSTLRTKLEDELPPILAGMTAPAIRMEMKKVHDEICRMMQEGSAKLA